jgi:hypothetical protein
MDKAGKKERVKELAGIDMDFRRDYGKISACKNECNRLLIG